MRILNLIWKFGEGGIAKCFLTYAAMGDVDNSIEVVSACIDPLNCDYDRKHLWEIGARIIPIKSSMDLTWMRKTYKLIQKVQPNVIFCHGFNGPIIVSVLRLRYKIDIPMVCSYHGTYTPPTKNKRWISPLFNNLMFFLYRKKAAKVIAVSNFSKKELIKNKVPDNKIVVVHNGIKNIEIKTSAQGSAGPIKIGTMSRLDPIKGINVLIDAAGLIKSSTDMEFSIDIVGNGPMEDELKEKVRQQDLGDVVSFAGYQSDIPKWLAKWDIVCLPSFMECHSIAILETMRIAKALVTTRVGGNEESVTDEKEALIVPAGDVEKLAGALIRLMRDKTLREILGKNARRRYEREFTEDVMKKNLAKVFISLI